MKVLSKELLSNIFFSETVRQTRETIFKCLLYLGNQFVQNLEILYVASVQKISERVFFFGRT